MKAKKKRTKKKSVKTRRKSAWGDDSKAKEVPIGSFSEFVKFVEKHDAQERILFRGQPKDKPLTPKIARIVPKESISITEKETLKEFKRRSIPFLQYQPKTEWDWLALAQHHGLATRLLDWTLNPLAALWFAVNKPPNPNKKGVVKNGVVWMFQPEEKDVVIPSIDTYPFKGHRTKVFQPNHITQRIIAQNGWFTVHKLIADKGFIPLERNRSYKPFLTKLKIEPALFKDMRYFLDRFGVTAASLFPDLDGICSHVQWMHSLLEDEKV